MRAEFPVPLFEASVEAEGGFDKKGQRPELQFEVEGAVIV